MPTHAKMVKPYAEAMPLFARYQVEGYLAGMFNPTVQLKSGGYIVIGVTEALVAIDINSGKATRQGSIEETALQTNLEAADEIARQLRLRDLAGLIVIDFIDMEERRNNAAVEKRLKDALRNDRARIQVGRISGFGLLEMSRQRLRPGMLEATTQPCPHCHGTGLIRSDNSIALAILRALEEEGVRARTKEVLVRAPIGIVNYLFNAKREHLAQIEIRYDMAIRIEADPSLVSPDYSLEKFKTATRVVRAHTPVVSLDAQTMSGVDEDLGEDEIDEIEAVDEPDVVVEAAAAAAPAAPSRGTEAGENGDGGRKKRRRRRRRRGAEGRDANGAVSDDASGEDANGDDEEDDLADAAEAGDQPAPVAEAAPTAEAPQGDEPASGRRRRTRGTRPAEAAPAAEAAVVAEDEGGKPKSRRGRGRGRGKAGEGQVGDAEAGAEASPAPAEAVSEAAQPEVAAEVAAEKPAKPRRSRRKAEPEAEPAAEVDETVAEDAPVAAAQPEPASAPAPLPAPATAEPAEQPAVLVAGPKPTDEPAPEPEAEAVAATGTATPEGSDDGKPAKPRRLGWWSRKA
jgi:ribonuclease E